MKEPEEHILLESIDQLTEHSPSKISARDSRLIADLYQTYALFQEENGRSLQRIRGRFAQALENRRASTSIRPLEEREGVDAQIGLLDTPVNGLFQERPQPFPGRVHRSFSRRSSRIAVAVVLLLILGWALLMHAFFLPSSSTVSETVLDSSLILAGNSQLDQHVVFLVKSSENGHYLAVTSYSNYEENSWTNSAVSSSPWPANEQTVSEGSPVHLVTQQITVVDASEASHYIIAAGQIASVNQPTTVLINTTTGKQVAVLLSNQQEPSGGQYMVQSYVSTADITALRSIPLPADAPKLPSNHKGSLPRTYYSPPILSAYLQLPRIDPQVKVLAQQLTKKAHSMYDKVVALESYFHTAFTYTAQVNRPLGAEATAWLLYQSDHKGFDNYFATSMAVMARELGIPARVVVGYTPGDFDPKTQSWTEHGYNAHSWTQIYFAGYGWVDFEPSPSFAFFHHNK